MKHWDTMTVTRVGQGKLPKWWRDSSGLLSGGVVEVRPLDDGKNSIVLTPASSNRRGVTGKELLKQFASCPKPLATPARHTLLPR